MDLWGESCSTQTIEYLYYCIEKGTLATNVLIRVGKNC